jgi:MFS family permease
VTEVEEETRRSFLVTLVALTFAMNLVARGVPETFAVFLLPVQKGLGVSRADITLTYSVYMIAYGVSGPLAGQLVDRLGARVAYSFGLLSLGSGYLLAGFATELWHYLVTVGLLGGLGAAALGMIVASALLSRWFMTRIGSIMSLPYAAIGAGMLMLPPLTQVLISRYDWRIAHMVLGAGVLATLPLVMLLPLGRMSAGSQEWRALRKAAASSASRRRRAPALSGDCLPPISSPRLPPTASCRTRSPTSSSSALHLSLQRARSGSPACCRRSASSPSVGCRIASAGGRRLLSPTSPPSRASSPCCRCRATPPWCWSTRSSSSSA